jgi:hypothetical protein
MCKHMSGYEFWGSNYMYLILTLFFEEFAEKIITKFFFLISTSPIGD